MCAENVRVSKGNFDLPFKKTLARIDFSQFITKCVSYFSGSKLEEFMFQA